MASSAVRDAVLSGPPSEAHSPAVDVSPTGRAVAHLADAVLDLDRLSDVYRVRDAERVPVRQRDLPMLERAVRKQVAQYVLTHQLPALVAELLEAAADDLAPVGDVDTVEGLEAEANVDLRVFEAAERCKAVLDAVGLEALARLQSDIEASEDARFTELGRAKPPGWTELEELTVMEVCAATGLGDRDVHARLRLGTSRTASAADLRSRLRAGGVTLYRACTIHDEIAQLPDESSLRIVAATLREKDGAPPSPSLFRQRLTRLCLAADRDAAERRRARQRRGAHARIDKDGLGVFTVTNDADKIIAAMERVDALARAARQAGDPRDLDALRADIITDTLMFGWPTTATQNAGDGAGSHPGNCNHAMAPGSNSAAAVEDWYTRIGQRPAARVTIIVPFTTAVGETDAPCEVPGYGWVAAQQARQIILNPGSTWRRLAVDVDTGAALELQTEAYRPTAAMRAHVEAVDGTCRAPGCTVPAARCDLDHDIPWPQGPTRASNLTSKHRPHHNLHTHAHWHVHRDLDDRVHWRTKAGRRYVTRPKDWLEGLRDWPSTPPVSPSTLPGRPSPRTADDDPPPF